MPNNQQPNGRMFCPHKIMVSIFECAVPNYSFVKTSQNPQNDYQSLMCPLQEISLLNFLTLGEKYLTQIQTIRNTSDKSRRDMLKRKTLPAATISATFSTRSGNIPIEDKLVKYNSIVVLDFDALEDPESSKVQLSRIPYVYYVGLSVSGKGLFAIIPIDTEDYREHKIYFTALEEQMQDYGFTVDKACKDVGRLRVLSYDASPYINEDCTIFQLPNEDISLFPSTQSEETFFDESANTPHKVELYVQKWEEMEVELNDYQDWLLMGMALTSLKEYGRELFHRISRFSYKYCALENDNKYTELLQHTRQIGIGTFFYKCHTMGVLPNTPPHYNHIQFPVEVLPQKIRDIVWETHNCLNFPIDYITPSLIFAASIACGNSVCIEIKHTWTDKTIFYMAIVGDRGTNKSSCLSFALEPLREKDRREYEKYKTAKILYDAEFKKPLKERNMQIEEPMYVQTILSDFTSEVLIRQHKHNPRGLAVYIDELIGFIKNFNKYRSGSDEQMWTQLFNGNSVIVNRISSEPVNINNTCIGVVGTIQPDILKEFAKNKVASGFIDRWLFAYPDKVPYPELNDNEIDKSITATWNEIIRNVLDIEYHGTSRVLKFSPKAKKIYTDWFNNLSYQKNTASATFAGMATKMERYCARFSLILEVLKYACKESDLTEISAESVNGAIGICYYFMASAQKAHRKFSTNPLLELNDRQRTIYRALPITFETGEGVEIAKEHQMSERTFKSCIKTDFFKHLRHGYYEKRYK